MKNPEKTNHDPLFKWQGKSPPIPKNEQSRLQALKSYQVLDTFPEPDFDALTEIASFICDTPIALISLVDSNRQWFKSRIGLDAPETPREISFCQYAVLQDDILEISNALMSPILEKNPLVTDSPNIRFYAGAPLTNPEGLNIGTLCVIDNKPRKLTTQQKKALKALAQQVINQLELRSKVMKEREMGEIKGRFISLISHQFRTPLSIIRSNVELIEMLTSKHSAKHDEQAKRYLERIQKEIDSMTRLMDDVLIINKLNNNSINHNPVLQNVEEIVQSVILNVEQTQKDGRKIEFEVVGKPHPMKIDKRHLEIIVRKLLSNAFKYSSHKNPGLLLKYDKDAVQIWVRDAGIGIPEKDLTDIFKPFHRSENVSEIRGSGLGLTIAKELVELNFGTIWVSTETGEHRTIFKLNFPTSNL